MPHAQNENRDISVIAGVFVENEKGEVLFVKMPKWNDTWGIPGGHVDRNETLEVGALRELKEETGIHAEHAEFIGTTEMIEPNDFHKSKHFISFQFRVRVEGRPEVELEEREISDFRWMTLAEAHGMDDLNSIMRKTLDTMMSSESCEQGDYKEKWLRARADYQNLCKEIDVKKSEWLGWSKKHILEEFIPVYDNFKKAFGAEDANGDSWKKGIEYIKKQFGDILKKHGVEEIRTVGEPFNPTYHEAVGEEEGEQDGFILKEADAGYTMNGKVIKAAKVIVAVSPDTSGN